LLIIAVLNLIQLAVKPLSQDSILLSATLLILVIAIAFFRLAPVFQKWVRILFMLSIPLLLIFLAALYEPIHQFMNIHGNVITTLGVLYAVLFALVPPNPTRDLQ
jgi:hypothetical protein